MDFTILSKFRFSLYAFVISRIFYLLIEMDNVCGHGRLVDPPSRSSAWRFGFKTPINYNDNELFCGGFTTQWSVNKGKCGICGDPYNGKRDNELPNGKYAKNLEITRTYQESSDISVKVLLTANHKGYFIFKICPAIDDSVEVSQQCLDKFPLEVVNLRNTTKYMVTSNRAKMFLIRLKLPIGLTCDRCVLQWTYICGNNWGKCEGNKRSALGCGPQETFRGCADVRIIGNINAYDKVINENNTIPPLQLLNNTTITNSEREKPTNIFDKLYYFSNNISINLTNKPKFEKNCRATTFWRSASNIDQWCRTNCALNFCPQSHCICS